MNYFLEGFSYFMRVLTLTKYPFRGGSTHQYIAKRTLLTSYHVHYLLPHFFCLRIIMLVLGPYASTYLIWWLLLLTFRCFTITQNKENIGTALQLKKI
jgi:hypothetical protein